jgi:hypothetical protein
MITQSEGEEGRLANAQRGNFCRCFTLSDWAGVTARNAETLEV